MSRGVLVGFLVIAIAGVLIPGFLKTAQAAAPGCDNRDLRGSYGLVGRSSIGPTPTSVTSNSFGYLGVINFDGQGAFSALITLVGVPGTTFSGTYTVSPDCRGGISSGVFPAELVVVQGGNEVLFTTLFALGLPLPVTGVMVKTARAAPGCDNHDLRGSYGLVGSGVFGNIASSTGATSFGFVAVIDFDGQGAFSALISGTTYFGTYSVQPDCSAEILGIMDLVVVQGNEVLFATTADANYLFPTGTTGVMERIK